MPEFTATISLPFGITAKDDEAANFKLECVSSPVEGYLVGQNLPNCDRNKSAIWTSGRPSSRDL